MKKFLISLAIALAIAVVGITTARPANAAGYSCTYKMTGYAVYATVYGSDNNAFFCRQFASGAGSSMHRTYYPMGGLRCVFVSNNMFRVYIRVNAPIAWQGNITCSMFGRVKGWSRVG